MRPIQTMLAGAFVASMVVVGCSGVGLDALNCYAPAPIPDNAVLYDCYVDCGCDEQPMHETAAAWSDSAALLCWENELKATGMFVSAKSFGCTYMGIYHPDPGGKPNANDGEGGDEN